MDYKDTINLPQTDFPMKANLAQREPQMLKRWQQEGLYAAVMEGTAGRDRDFVMHDGPPYANGAIHIGHAVNKILKDIVVRSKLLDGYHAPYVPGWDCHGLPIELQVEKKVGKVGQKVDAATFRQKCREYAARQIAQQCEDFQRLGGLGDWDRPYRSMDFRYEADIVRALAKIVENGHLHQGVKPVHWCFDCGSALAEAEIEYQDKISPGIDVAFPAVDSAAVAQAFGLTGDEVPVGEGSDIAAVIWTTTPWTLPANQAIAVHPELSYVLVRHDDRVLLLAADLADAALTRYGTDGQAERLAEASGQALEGLRFVHPFYDRHVPIVLGDHVTTESGTGCVHTAPGHGAEDFDMGKKYDLPILNPVGPRGVFNDEAPGLQGEHVWKANDHIVEMLREHKALLACEKYPHSYPHCWRHKTPTAFRVTPQWFIDMDQQGLRRQALHAIPDVRWVPDWGQARIESMIEGRPDWCISRQRTWGVPIALFAHAVTGEPHPDSAELMRRAADLIEEGGIDAWYELDPRDLIGDDAGEYEKVTDILDVWFDSGVSHFAVLEQRDELRRPADLYLEGSDQHRGWFQSSLLTSIAMHGEAPYRQVLTHGFVVDAEGRKMSKSVGNVVSPQEVTKTLGADILRWWVAASDYRYEITISDEILKRVADSYRRVRNTARYLLGNLNGFEPGEHALPVAELLPLDQWAVARAHEVQQAVITGYDDYQFHTVQQRVHHFCAVDMGAFYLDVIKDRLYTMQPDSRGRRSAQTAMHLIAEAMVRWIAPILCFTAEEIWPLLPGERPASTVMLATWADGLAPLADDAVLAAPFWEAFEKVREQVGKELEALRRDGAIRSSLDASVTLYADESLYETLLPIHHELRFFLLTSDAQLRPANEGGNDMKDGLAVSVAPCEDAKCVRCWHRRPDVGMVEKHPELCGRCVVNVEGKGETRHFG